MIDLAPEHLKTLQDIFKKNSPGIPVWIFGSRATANAKPFSDIDLVLKATERVPDPMMVKLRDAFDESNLPYQVDLIDWHQVSPEFQAAITKHCEKLPD